MSKLYVLGQEIRDSKNYDVKVVENYFDNGDSFTASVSLLPKKSAN